MLIENIDLSKALNESLQRRDFYFSPSRAGGCARAMYYEFYNYEAEELNQHIFEDGRVHEDLTIQFLTQSENVEILDRQRPVNIYIPERLKDKISLLPKGKCEVCGQEVSGDCLHGHIDGIFKVKNPDGTYTYGLFEHKAVKDDVVRKYKKQGVWSGYLTQVAFYCRGLNLDKGVVFIKNKNNATYLEAEVRYDAQKDLLVLVRQRSSDGSVVEFNFEYPEITNKAFEKFVLVESHIKKEEVPEFNIEDTHFCFNCPYRNHCEENLINTNLNETVSLESLAEQERKYLINAIHEYFSLKNKQQEIESEIENAKNRISNFFNYKKIKSVKINNIPVYLVTKSKSHTSFDEEKLKKYLTEEQYLDCIASQKTTYYQSIFIPPSQRPALVEIVSKIKNDFNARPAKQQIRSVRKNG